MIRREILLLLKSREKRSPAGSARVYAKNYEKIGFEKPRKRLVQRCKRTDHKGGSKQWQVDVLG